jgi:hypothetical protein
LSWSVVSCKSKTRSRQNLGQYGDEIRFGYLDRSRIAAFPHWSMKHLGRIFENQTTAPNEAPHGYYLFTRGRPIAFHPGTSPNTDHDLTAMGIGAVAALITQSTKPWSASPKLVNQKAAEGVIAFFEAVVVNPPPRTNPAGSANPVESPAKPDPYVVLGLPPTASDQEVRTAYREQQRLNHPDFVASMSPEVQKVAHQRTQAINEAYSTIMERRRKA